MARNGEQKSIRVTLVRSMIGTLRSHRACVRGLGLRHLHDRVEVPDTPAIRGMIKKVGYLLKCEETGHSDLGSIEMKS
jgi:large subunit ribosomal protein L30